MTLPLDIMALMIILSVFCRVRPPLPSDGASSDGDQELAPVVANIDYPDKRDHKEIVLSSSSESATGAERKEVWNFGFDRVRMVRPPLAMYLMNCLEPGFRTNVDASGSFRRNISARSKLC